MIFYSSNLFSGSESVFRISQDLRVTSPLIEDLTQVYSPIEIGSYQMKESNIMGDVKEEGVLCYTAVSI